MTIHEFTQLSVAKQEAFLESGGQFSAEQAVLKETPKEAILSCSSLAQVEQVTQEKPVEVSAPVLVDFDSSSTPPQDTGDTEVCSLPSVSPSIFEQDKAFDFQDPLEMLILLDDDVRTSRVQLSKLQVQALLDFGEGGSDDKHPYQAVFRWPNGSGKDKYIIAPEVVWLGMRFKLSSNVVTSSSGVQLDNQTCNYIELLAKQANRKWGNIWKCNYRYYECLPTESQTFCYATDEAGKAEGYHPLRFGSKMALFESEAKTVPDAIYVAQNKCTGYTHRVIVSTPGNTVGHFYDLCSSAVNRKDIKSVLEVSSMDYIHYHATAYEFSHISKHYIEQMKRDLPGGEFGAGFKSQVLAEFSAAEDQVVVPYSHLWRLRKAPPQHIPEPYNKAGLDLSDGGAETVLFVRNGNKMLKCIPFRFDDTEDTIKFLETQFEDNGLTSPEAYIYGDTVGIGKPILDRLRRRGWRNIRYFDSRRASYHPTVYFRYGDEVWFTFAKRVERGEIILLEDTTLIKQLSNRYWKFLEGKHKLLSKPEQKSKGFPSPDRADACVYAFSDYSETHIRELDSKQEKPFELPEEKVDYRGDFTMKGSATGRNKPHYTLNDRFNVNNGNKDFRLLQEEIAEHNIKVKL